MNFSDEVGRVPGVGFPAREAKVRIGAFSVSIRVQADEPGLMADISELYAGYPQEAPDGLADVSIALRTMGRWGGLGARRLQVYINGREPYQAVEPRLGVPMLESAINLYLGKYVARYLLIHAAVVERGGLTVVMPGPSGSGKSTLTAALIHRGWRLLSDEVAMIRPSDGSILPHPRPISLKNQSIDLIADRFAEAELGRRYEGTTKGTMAYLRPSSEAIERADDPARPGAVVFLRYAPESESELKALERGRSFMGLVGNAANYLTLLEVGFETLASTVERCEHYALSYRSLDEAVGSIESLETVST